MRKSRSLPQHVASFLSKQFSSTKKSLKIPPETCPLINEVQDYIERSKKALEEIVAEKRKSPLTKEAATCIRLLKKAEEKLEKIRDANSQLRKASYDWRYCANSMLDYARDPWNFL